MVDRLQTMTVFVAVAEEAGFAPAARKLGMSPPAVTRAISELEERLGARLLHRTTRSTQLTEAGARYLSDCRRIIADLDEAERHAASIHAAPRGQITISASVPFGSKVLMPIIFELMDEYPELSVSMPLANRIVHMFEDGIDIAVRIADLPDSSLIATRVGFVKRILCASPSYLDSRGRPQSPGDLKDHAIINFANMTPSSEWPFAKDGLIKQVKLESQFRVNNADLAIGAALAGRGITRVLSYMISSELAAQKLEIVLPDWTPPLVPIHIVHKEAGQTSARVRATVDFLVARLRDCSAIYH
ncbi:MAG: LysR family transcriptional regulator [Hyphomicrobiaceae bacterium]